MEAEYNHKNIEAKWQEKWEMDGVYKVADSVPGKQNHLTLVEFSYPSGNLHVGHWYAFSVPDIFARYKRMQGFNSLYPMGFDAFGLPAENAAIKLGEDPKTWTYSHMDKMRIQLRSMGTMFDWSREVVSCSPEYYKWTQFMFAKFFENDLAYRSNTKVNWCPKDMTILANEQVVDGKCDRCGTVVEQKNQDQWMLRITKYADSLIDDLNDLNWPDSIKESQRNWIGRSEGSEIEFKIKDSEKSIKIFTTRADTLFGVTYVVLAPEHPLVQDFVLTFESGVINKSEIEAYVLETKNKSELDRQQAKEKTGVQVKGVMAINPANGEEVPVWVADYVLAGYGTGAVMGVPQHDERDHEFATKYNLPIIDRPLVDTKDITEKVGGQLVKKYRLRDWGISRQRYWGVPIPIVYDPQGVAHAIPVEHLPWLLPTDVDHTPDGTAPLARSKELFERTEKIFGAGWTPEVETMDTFVDSSWYFYRYLDPKNENEFCSREKMEQWLPINLYMGGAEHTTMHVLYSRFWTKALHEIGLVNNTEEFTIRKNRGLILGPDGEKMSKSKGNVIDPDEIVERLGADTVRMYLAFMGPYGVTVNYPWDPNGVVGVRRFLERVWRFVINTTGKNEPFLGSSGRPILGSTRPSSSGLFSSVVLHKAIKKITEDIEEHKYNTAISQMMICLNEFEKSDSVSVNDIKIFLQLLAPFAPHMTEELWHMLGETESIHVSDWPKYDESKIIDSEFTIAIQVNGKVRDEIVIGADVGEEEVKQMALASEKVQKWIAGEEVKKIIYIKNKIVSINV
jgi:leucyl-tRNA synthetase